MNIMIAEEKIAVIQKQVGGQSKEYLRLVDETETQSQRIAELKKQLSESETLSKKSEVVIKQARAQQDEYMRLCDRYNELEVAFLFTHLFSFSLDMDEASYDFYAWLEKIGASRERVKERFMRIIGWNRCIFDCQSE